MVGLQVHHQNLVVGDTFAVPERCQHSITDWLQAVPPILRREDHMVAQACLAVRDGVVVLSFAVFTHVQLSSKLSAVNNVDYY
jgi:hypothetical protein